MPPKGSTFGKLYTFGGRSQTLTQWAREFGLTTPALQQRLYRGWEPDIERLSRPANRHIKTQVLTLTYQGRTESFAWWAAALDVRVGVLYKRKRDRWSDVKTLTTPFIKRR